MPQETNFPQEIQRKSLQLGSASLTVTTVILAAISIWLGGNFAPFIILLMSFRIAATVYTLVKLPTKKEVVKLILWSALMTKSIFSFCEFLTGRL